VRAGAVVAVGSLPCSGDEYESGGRGGPLEAHGVLDGEPCTASGAAREIGGGPHRRPTQCTRTNSDRLNVTGNRQRRFPHAADIQDGSSERFQGHPQMHYLPQAEGVLMHVFDNRSRA